MEIKYPEAGDGRPEDATEYISNYLNAVFDALWAGELDTFEEKVDINSFIDYVLLNELCSNSDAVYKSIYVSKKIGENEKMKFGPVWDFDGAFGFWTGNPDDSEVNAKNAFSTIYFSRCQFVEKYFKNANEVQYQNFVDRYFELSDKIDEFYMHLVNYKTIFNDHGINNQNIWYGNANLFEKNYTANLNFLNNHHTYLRTLFSHPLEEFISLVYNA